MFEKGKYIEVIAEGQEEKIEAAHELIDEVLSKQIKLGEGQNAEIFFSSDQAKQEFCVKQLKENPDRPHYQSIDWEMRLQDQAHQLGVKVPQPVLSLMTEEGESFMVMETIKGKSLKEVMSQALELPATYKHEKFWRTLEDMLARLHEAGLYHRDLHPGNMMVDFESGEPILIDFGYAAYVPGGDDPYREINSNIGHLEGFPNDDQEFKKCKRVFAGHLTEINK